MTAAAQVLTMVLAAVVIVWHQQRSVDKLRTELRAEMREGFAEVREEIVGLRTEVAFNGQRLARIEGYFGMGMSEEAAAAAAGARFAPVAPAPQQG